MEKFCLETERLIITEFDESMIKAVQENSLDEDNRRFVPDEVWETVEQAHEKVLWLMDCYRQENKPLVYPVLLKIGENIGYVQICPLGGDLEGEWEIGYHIAKKYTGNGYATEALKSFLQVIMERLKISKVLGIVAVENIASCAVLERCGFDLEFKGPGNYQGNVRPICRYVYNL